MTSSVADGVVVVGAGVSGLRVASLLCERGVPCRLLDARAEAGGRATSVVSRRAGNAVFDLGPTWHWPESQPRMKRLVAELRLSAFPQHSLGSVLIERFRLERAQEYVVTHAPASAAWRLEGGMRSLVEALLRTLPTGTLQLEKRVLAIDCRDPRVAKIELQAGASGVAEQLACRGVVLAMPPRVAARLPLQPSLPEPLRLRFDKTPTWLGAQAKAIAVYQTPFWRQQGYSGLASSVIGPLQEIHDASPLSGVGALFGFFGLSPLARRRLKRAELRELVLAQLARLFGEAARTPLDFIYKDWAEEPYISSALDLELPNQYLSTAAPLGADERWHGRLLFAGTEQASEHAGYLEGALEAAERTAELALHCVSR
ncbi:MAG: FAD-dependent oxidoreductase [Myxococcales bacterium]